MKKENCKKIMSFLLSGSIFITGGCGNVNDKKVKIIDKDDNMLVVMVSVDSDKEKERYGYLIEKKKEVLFEDIIDGETYDITNMKVYYCDFRSILTFDDYKFIEENGYIKMGRIKFYDKDCKIVELGKKRYGIYPYYGNGYAKTMRKLDTKR